MAYALLILEPHGQRESRTEAEARDSYAQMLRFSEELRSQGLLTFSQALKSDAEGVQVTMRDGRASLVDGPFAESKEMIGGILLLTCEGREQALAIARTCPAVGWATVEVRELGPCFS